MKKKISLIVAVLVLVLGLAGCGNAKTVSYDKDTLSQSCDSVFDIIQSGSISSDQITEMSDWNQGYLMAQFESQTKAKLGNSEVRVLVDSIVSRKMEEYFEENPALFNEIEERIRQRSSDIDMLEEPGGDDAAYGVAKDDLELESDEL